MKTSVLYGGDLHSALDWLCLNLRDGNLAPAVNSELVLRAAPRKMFKFADELPEGFSQQMQEESQRNRPRFQPPVRPRTQSPELPITPPSKDAGKVCSYKNRK